MCLMTMNNDPCSHPECHYYYRILSMGKFPIISNNTMEQLSQMVCSQNIVLTTIVQNNKRILEYLESLMEETQRISRMLTNTRYSELVVEDSSQVDQIFTWAKADKKFPYKISLDSSLNLPLFKERGFHVTISVKGEDERMVVLRSAPRFRIALFSMDNPPKMLTVNIAGKKILRGTLESEFDEQGIVNFPNVVINEVSSHYVNDGFYMVVYNLSNKDVQPLILSNITVRARKPLKPSSRFDSEEIYTPN
jgi:hypothetical protein